MCWMKLFPLEVIENLEIDVQVFICTRPQIKDKIQIEC